MVACSVVFCCWLGYFLLLVRFHICTCAIYILMFFIRIPIFYCLLASADAGNCHFITVYYVFFLPAPGSLGFLWPLYPFLCIVYNCIYYTTVRETFPIVCIDSKTTMYPCVLTLTMYVCYVLFVPNKPFVR